MGDNRWDQEGTPHKGWTCVDVIDLRAEGQSAEETDYAVCQMCGNERIRHIHVMTHPEVHDSFEVGCICAEKMSDDYDGPRKREAKLKSRAATRARWLTRKWRISSKGSHFLNIDEHNLGVYQIAGGRWKCWLNQKRGTLIYSTCDEAKLGLFNAFWRAVHED